MDQHRSKLPKDKDTKIVAYCLTGPMGYIAAGKLVDIGCIPTSFILKRGCKLGHDPEGS
jgi:rhodanese-related sulfurtransferase